MPEGIVKSAVATDTLVRASAIDTFRGTTTDTEPTHVGPLAHVTGRRIAGFRTCAVLTVGVPDSPPVPTRSEASRSGAVEGTAVVAPGPGAYSPPGTVTVAGVAAVVKVASAVRVVPVPLAATSR
ncbi:MAG: hypothetical protein AAGC46_18685 [Solirubrobacteraceae bacterium]|nr:hypothetical protein [Patulibacter sp.]